MFNRIRSRRQTGPTACILVVEDDRPVRDVLVEFLGGQGYRTLAAASAAEARRAIAAGPVDLVVADCVLFGEQGEEFAQYAAALGVPAILITGDGGRLTAARQQGRRVLRKPFRLAELAELIAGVLTAAAAICREDTGG